MKHKVYINGVCAISAQKTFDNQSFLEDITAYNDTVIKVVDPVYKAFIPPASARRMAKGIKMGIVASKLALQDANIDNVDAIITGTGLGCVRDSEKFVSTLIDHDEQFLTPTSFIQSTHNTVAGQIALELQCKGYNFTYVHGSNSFESAVLDAKLQLEHKEEDHILVGGVDELGPHTVKIHKLIHHIKEVPVAMNAVLRAQSKGAVFSEGGNFFVLSNTPKQTSYAEVMAVKMYNTLDASDIEAKALAFLQAYDIAPEAIDVLILGCNGDIDYDHYYDGLQTLFSETQQLCYKHLSGEFYTASSFGFWLGARVLKSQSIPEITKLNTVSNTSIKTILLYNQYRGENHSFTLLRQC